jgi:hypothetical protein
MGGLMRALAGGLKGLGDGMIDKAKADREAAIVALARTNAVADRDAGYAQQDKLQGNTFAHDDTFQQAGFTHADTSQQAQFGQQNTITDKEIAAHHADAVLGANTSTSNTAAQIAAAKNLQDSAANQFSNVTQSDDGTMYATNKNGQAVTVTNKATGQPMKALGKDIGSGAYTAAIHASLDADGAVDQDKLNSIVQSLRANRTPDASKILPPAAPEPSIAERLTNWLTPSPTTSGGGLTTNMYGTKPGANTSAVPSAAPVKITGDADYAKVKSGAQYIDPNGVRRTKP